MGESSNYLPGTALFIEVAKKAANGLGIDVPRSILSHVLRKRTDRRASLTCDILASILKNTSLPSPAEQANNLILYLGDSLSSPGAFITMPARRSTPQQENIYGLLGIQTGKDEWNDLLFIVTSLEAQQLLKLNYEEEMTTSFGTLERIPKRMSLTFAGWQKVEELRRSVKNSRKAFVAMEFPNPEKTEANYFFQNKLLDKYLVPAVKKAEYDLVVQFKRMVPDNVSQPYSYREEWLVSPRQVVEDFVKRFNENNASALAELYHEDAVNPWSRPFLPVSKNRNICC
jgi:hypothetical protein